MSLLYCFITFAATYYLPQTVNGLAHQQKHEPYLDGAVYDMGPRNKCVVYPVKMCAGVLSNKTRVPQFSAFMAPMAGNLLQVHGKLVSQLATRYLSKECANFFLTLACQISAQPLCNSNNTMVTFTQGDGKTFERVEN